MNYQNYQSLPQYQNQFMQQPFQPMQNFYMDRLSQLQSQQNIQNGNFSNNQNFLSLGKIVESIDIVKATDIPMDGNMYYFPKADGTEVYMKRWLPNGTTEIIPYKPLLQNEEIKDNKSIDITNLIQYLNDIQNDIKILNEKVDKFSKPIKNGNKKEVIENEQHA